MSNNEIGDIGAIAFSKALKKDCYGKNNARNRDILTRQKAQGQHIYIEEIKESDNSIKDFLGEERDNLDNTSDSSDEKT